MSILFGGAARAVPPASCEAPRSGLPPGWQTPYLTDGVNLLRYVGSGMGHMVGLENCRTLAVNLFTAAELRARRLRPVFAVAGD
jgi:hypothetical protein